MINQPHISVHAEERFMQRVFDVAQPSTTQLQRAGHMLSMEIGPCELADGAYPLPSFYGFKFVIKNNTVVTVRKSSKLKDNK